MSRWNYEKVKQLYEDSGCVLMEEEYKGLKEPHRFLCRCGNPHENQFRNFVRGERQCKLCRYMQTSKSKLMSESDIEKRVLASGCVLQEFSRKTTSKNKIEIWVTYQCNLGHTASERLTVLSRRGYCAECSKENMNRDKVTPYITIFQEFKSLGLNLLTPEEEYINTQQKLKYTCECGSTAYGYLRGLRDGIRCGCKRPRIRTEEERIQHRSYPEYKQWRRDVLNRDHNTCIQCKVSKNLEVHHIYSYTKYSELRTDVDNGVTLCKSCHVKFHSRYGFFDFTPTDLTEFLQEGEDNIGVL